MAFYPQNIIAGLLVIAVIVLSANSAPTHRTNIQLYQLLSRHSDNFLSVTPSGDIQAKASHQTDPSTLFIRRDHKFPYVSFESNLTRGHSIVIDAKKQMIRVEPPQSGSELFKEVGHLYDGISVALQSKDTPCYLAFDQHGGVASQLCEEAIAGQIHTFLIVLPYSGF